MSVEAIDQLLAVAEIASVFIGFVALMSALSTDRFGAVRLVAIIVTSSVTMVACITPTVLGAFGLGEAVVIRTSAVVFAGFNAAIVFWQFRWVPGFREGHQGHKVVAGIVWGLEFPLWGSLCLCAAGVTDFGVGLYFLAVALLIMEIVVFLLDLILQVARHDSPLAADVYEKPSLLQAPASSAQPIGVEAARVRTAVGARLED